MRTVPVGGRLVVPASSLEQLLGLPSAERDGGTGCPDENLNEVAIAGRLVAEPVVRDSKKGLRYATMRLSLRGGGPAQEPFHVVVVAFGVCAERFSGLKPGELVRVDGRLGQRDWTAEDGVRIGAQRVVADRVRTLEAAGQVAS